MLLLGLVVVGCFCVGAFALLQAGGGLGDLAGPDASVPAIPLASGPQASAMAPQGETLAGGLAPTASGAGSGAAASGAGSSPFDLASEGTEGPTWLVMLYEDADDRVLERDIDLDLNEAERVGSSAKLRIVAQMDRYRGGFGGDGDWTSARRYFVTRDDNLDVVSSQLVADLGEVNMADGQTLVDFVVWAVETYPSDRYVLILSDHGMGWPGGWTDSTSSRGAARGAPIEQALGDVLYLDELDAALATARQRAGIDRFELVGLDACLMGHAEVMSALAPHARYAVASQETEPSLGWAYASFLNALRANPALTGAELGQAIVDSYVTGDQRITDDRARADLVGRAGLFAAPSASDVARQLTRDATLTAFDLGGWPAVRDSLNELALALQSADQRKVARARSYAQSFTSIWGRQVPPSYIDLGHFAGLLEQLDAPELSAPVDRLVSALDRAVVAEKKGPNKPGATGLSVYFPNSELYASPVAGAASYTTVAGAFARESLWDDFLAFHYAGRRFAALPAAPAVPERGASVVGPGAGEISLSNLTLSAGTVGTGETVEMRADVAGENVGYVKLLVAYLDRTANSIMAVDTDFVESSDTRQLNGIYYPDWGTGPFQLRFEWEPVVFAIDDGSASAVALFRPLTYGATDEEATYAVDGTYGFADGSAARSAQLVFGQGQLLQVFLYTGADRTGAPAEMRPGAGDTFTLQETWLDLDEGDRVVREAVEPGPTLTFGAQPWSWKTLDAAAGSYWIGYSVEDLDGRSTSAVAPIEVR